MGLLGVTGTLSLPVPSADIRFGVGVLDRVESDASYRSRLERGVSLSFTEIPNAAFGVPKILATDGIPRDLETGESGWEWAREVVFVWIRRLLSSSSTEVVTRLSWFEGMATGFVATGLSVGFTPTLAITSSCASSITCMEKSEKDMVCEMLLLALTPSERSRSFPDHDACGWSIG